MIVPGSTNSLWNAVKAAKNVNVTSLPKFLYEDNIKINEKSVPDRFAAFFDDKIRKILNIIGLQQNAYDPCLFSGNIIDPSEPINSPTSSPLTLGLYDDNFVYFLADPAVEEKFEQLLK